MIQAVSPESSVSACAARGDNKSTTIEASLFVRHLNWFILIFLPGRIESQLIFKTLKHFVLRQGCIAREQGVNRLVTS
jgi:hypothetical protein